MALRHNHGIGIIRRGFLLAVGGLLIFALLLGCGKQDVPRSEEALSGEFPTSWARNTVTVFTTGGTKTTEIFSDSVVNFAEKDSTQAYTLRVMFYDADGEWMSQLTADSGIIRENSERLEVFGRVNVATRDSVRLQTTQLAWDPARAKIVSEQYVQIDQRGSLVAGYGFESDSDLKNIKLKRQVTGEIQDYEKAVDSL